MSASLFGTGGIINVNVNGSLVPQSFTGSAGQTVFVITNFTYTVGTNSLLVFINGQRQISGRDFSETSISSFTLFEGVVAGDFVDVIGFPQVTLSASDASTQTYTQKSVAGATPSTVQKKLDEVVSVKDFGAVADGNLNLGTGTNNSPMFQAAINALGAGGVLFVPAGVYLLTSQITVPSDFTIRGAGNYATILVAPAAFNNATGLIRLNGVGGPPTIIENLAVSGQVGGAGAASVGIYSVANGVFLRNLWVSAFKTNVILGQTDNFLLDSAVEESVAGGTGVSIVSPDVTVANCVIYHCFLGLAISAVPFLDGTISISNVRTIACTSIGFYLTASSNINLSNCSAGHNNLTGLTSAGLYMNGCSNVIVTSFIARLGGGQSTTGIGIQIQGSSGVIVSASESTSFLDGINISGSTAVSVTGSQFNSNRRYGIYEAGNDQVTLLGNECYGNGTGVAADAGIHSENTIGFGVVNIISNICSQVGGGFQDYGIYASLTDNGGSTGVTNLTGNICQYNNTSDILLAGKTNRITMSGNIPTGGIGSAATVIVTAAAYTVDLAEESVIANRAGIVTLTLPPAAISIGRQIQLRTITANTVVSNAANIIPLAGGAAGTAILAAVAGRWASVRSDGANWQIMAAN